MKRKKFVRTMTTETEQDIIRTIKADDTTTRIWEFGTKDEIPIPTLEKPLQTVQGCAGNVFPNTSK